MALKRYPQIKKEHAKRYAKISKADMVEAYRDLFREFGDAGELDNEQWLADMEHRIEILKINREYDAKRIADGLPVMTYKDIS